MGVSGVLSMLMCAPPGCATATGKPVAAAKPPPKKRAKKAAVPTAVVDKGESDAQRTQRLGKIMAQYSSGEHLNKAKALKTAKKLMASCSS